MKLELFDYLVLDELTRKEEKRMERNWDLEEQVSTFFGIYPGDFAMDFIDSICKYLDVDTMNAMLKSIATDFDIDVDEEE